MMDSAYPERLTLYPERSRLNDTMDRIEDFFNSFGRGVQGSFQSSIEVLDIREGAHRLWVDFTRYGPGLEMPRIPGMPGLGEFEIPPPPFPPPPPPPTAWYERTWALAQEHPWKATGLTAGVLGTSLLVGYRLNVAKARAHGHASNERRKVVGECSH